ncbi:MAG: hypothetical protein Q9224_001413 [Gallowayella concinna]
MQTPADVLRGVNDSCYVIAGGKPVASRLIDQKGSSMATYKPASDEQTPLLGGTDPETEILTATINPSTSRKTSPSITKRTDEEVLDGLPNSEPNSQPKTTTGFASIISILLLGCFIANADGSIVLATYGTISSETGNLSNGSWLIVTFMLAVCAVQPTVSEHPHRSFLSEPTVENDLYHSMGS